MSRGRASGLLLGLFLLGAGGCGQDPEPTLPVVGAFVLDRAAYAEDLEKAEVATHAKKAAALAPEQRIELLSTLRERSRQTALAVSLRLELRTDGSFGVAYQFEKERGISRGRWTRKGADVTLRITEDAAGPVQRGAVVTARRVPEGLSFSGWPVPQRFLLRAE